MSVDAEELTQREDVADASVGSLLDILDRSMFARFCLRVKALETWPIDWVAAGELTVCVTFETDDLEPDFAVVFHKFVARIGVADESLDVEHASVHADASDSAFSDAKAPEVVGRFELARLISNAYGEELWCEYRYLRLF
jgi:hypothetical protein